MRLGVGHATAIFGLGIWLSTLYMGSTLLFNSLEKSIQNLEDVKLPNNYVTKGEIYKSQKFKGSYNIKSSEEKLVEKSRIEGIVSYIGFLKTDDKVISVNNINQNNSAVGRKSNAVNNATVFNYAGIMMKIKPIEECEKDEYSMQLKTHGNRISPAIALAKYEQGDTISIPTIRKYETNNRYRILNKIDYLYLNEIRKK